MKILIADDEVTVRVLVRRLLTKDFAVEIVEAPDGVAALNCMLSEPIDLLITDLAMPVMDGIETLATLRASPELADLPVVVMTGHPDEEAFKRAKALGIAGFVVKPFSVQDFRNRLDPIVRGLLPSQEPVESDENLIALTPGQRVLVVDRSPDFTAVAERVLSRLCRVEVAKHEFAAIKSCMETPPDAVLIGATSALMAPTALAQKIRGLSLPQPVRLIAALAPLETAPAAEPGLFDCQVVREIEGDGFEESVCRVVDDDTRVRLLLHPSSAWLDELFAANARLLATRARVEPTVHHARPALDDAVRWVASEASIRGRTFGWTLRVRCPLDVALDMARHDDGGRTDEISEAHAVKTVTALVTSMAGQWCDRARTHDLRCEAKAPVTAVQDCLGSGPDMDTPRHARRWLSCGPRDLAILEIGQPAARAR
jgi:CheY-like chemotaxis protein